MLCVRAETWWTFWRAGRRRARTSRKRASRTMSWIIVTPGRCLRSMFRPPGSPVVAQHLAPVAGQGGAPGSEGDLLTHEADAAVAQRDVDAGLAGGAAQGGPAAGALAVDVGLAVVDGAAAVEGALEEAAVHPRGA